MGTDTHRNDYVVFQNTGALVESNRRLNLTKSQDPIFLETGVLPVPFPYFLVLEVLSNHFFPANKYKSLPPHYMLTTCFLCFCFCFFFEETFKRDRE